MTSAERQGRRHAPVLRSYLQHIEAAPSVVFPLICPVREGDWLEGWSESCQMIWSASGVAEPGCVFQTIEPSRPATIWIITEHDPDRGAVAFARVTPGLVASTLRVKIDGRRDGTSAVSVHYAVVPTSPEGEAYAAVRYDQPELLDSVAWWERSMNHYLATGEMLRHVRPGGSP